VPSGNQSFSIECLEAKELQVIITFHLLLPFAGPLRQSAMR
jgi:hypothetical protein